MPKSHSSVLRRVSDYRNHLTVLLIFAFLSLGFLAAPRSLTSVLTSADAAATELFISEYIEGTSNNKAIEIYNGTGAPINLGTGGYNVQFYFNGQTGSPVTIRLNGTIAPGDVFVLAQASANATILAQADQTSAASWYNGDDVVLLWKGPAIIDAIGQFGFDPGTEWGSGLTSTADNTLRRKSTVCAGDPISNDAFNPAVEWDGFATDTFGGLGAHSCGGPTPTPTPPPAFKAIHEIQGPDAASPLVGQLIFTTGVVTARKSNGFFVQTEDANVDADPNTSQGLFAFTGSAPAVAVGDKVQVTGTVAEFFNLTEINVASGGILVQSSGNALPTPVSFTATFPAADGPLDQLEPLEGMRVSVGSVTSVAPTNEFGEIHTVVTGVARPFREPGIEAGLPIPPDPTSGAVDCCVPVWDRNPERIIIDTEALVGAAVLNVTSNVELTNVTGPLDFTFDEYKITPETAPVVASPNMTAVPVPDPAGSHFTVAGYNIENYTGGATQKTKAALAIRDLLLLPDIIGHVEIGSLAALQALADEVNSITLDATGTDPQYKAYLTPFGNGTQHVGFLVKESKVQVNSVTQERTGDTFINPNTGLPEMLHDRPPLVLDATVDPTGSEPKRVIVVVNHLRSFIDIEIVGGEGVRVRAKRKAQAEAVADLLNDLQTGNPGVPVISVGDYNAYQFSDGYTDPIATLKGTPTADELMVVDQSTDLVDPNFVNLTDTLPAGERYSFIFEGTPQALDHVLVNNSAASMVTNYAVGRMNADFPESYAGDAARPERNSDHDAPVAYFEFRETATAVDNVSVVYDVNGQNVQLTANVSAGADPVSEGTVTFTVKTADGTVIGTAGPANVADGTATANFALPGNVLPQVLTVEAAYSGGPSTLSSTGSGTLTVTYAVCTLYDSNRAVKSGSTYPIRLQLCDVNGVNLSGGSIQVKAVNVKKVSQQSTDLEVIDAGNANPDSNFRYDADLSGYAFNLKTTGLASGVYELQFTAGDDPTVHSVEFRVK